MVDGMKLIIECLDLEFEPNLVDGFCVSVDIFNQLIEVKNLVPLLGVNSLSSIEI